MTDSEGPIDWFAWDEGFSAACERDDPIMLFLSATWCRDCAEMEAEVLENPQIRANLAEFVPIKIDVDRHPRVRDRYNMGGFPSTVFCTPDGTIMTGATSLGIEGMRSGLGRVREVWADRSDPGRVPRALREDEPPAGELDGRIERRMAGQLEASFDTQYGGWGDSPKFPLPRTIEFALKRDREAARQSLEAIRTHLFDDYEGGFFRYAANRDWSEISHEKLTDENAALLRAFANAYLATGEEGYREVAGRTVEYLTTTLWTGDAFGASQPPGPEGSYGAPERRNDGSPDQTVYAGPNALAIDALLTYYAYTDDGDTKRFAERALDRLDELIEAGSVAHYAGGERDLLGDQARVLRALTTSREILGDEGSLDSATAVADHTIETLRVENGTFRDAPPRGDGLLSYPLYPLDTTAELADGLCALSVLTGENRYREIARDSLEAFAGASDRMGPELAVYGTAVSRLLDGPLVIRVGTPAGSDLHRAALRIADHEAVVVPDAARTGAVANIGERTTESVATPAELERAIATLYE
ncbi:MAG: thioredoxin domain-containing protein [Euryarchaeota archaeon]|nr:thioredoxin domain-containing protein [Euryarchaeota archaeon]